MARVATARAKSASKKYGSLGVREKQLRREARANISDKEKKELLRQANELRLQRKAIDASGIMDEVKIIDEGPRKREPKKKSLVRPTPKAGESFKDFKKREAEYESKVKPISVQKVTKKITLKSSKLKPKQLKPKIKLISEKNNVYVIKGAKYDEVYNTKAEYEARLNEINLQRNKDLFKLQAKEKLKQSLAKQNLNLKSDNIKYKTGVTGLVTSEILPKAIEKTTEGAGFVGGFVAGKLQEAKELKKPIYTKQELKQAKQRIIKAQKSGRRKAEIKAQEDIISKKQSKSFKQFQDNQFKIDEALRKTKDIPTILKEKPSAKEFFIASRQVKTKKLNAKKFGIDKAETGKFKKFVLSGTGASLNIIGGVKDIPKFVKEKPIQAGIAVGVGAGLALLPEPSTTAVGAGLIARGLSYTKPVIETALIAGATYKTASRVAKAKEGFKLESGSLSLREDVPFVALGALGSTAVSGTKVIVPEIKTKVKGVLKEKYPAKFDPFYIEPSKAKFEFQSETVETFVPFRKDFTLRSKYKEGNKIVGEFRDASARGSKETFVPFEGVIKKEPTNFNLETQTIKFTKRPKGFDVPVTDKGKFIKPETGIELRKLGIKTERQLQLPKERTVGETFDIEFKGKSKEFDIFRSIEKPIEIRERTALEKVQASIKEGKQITFKEEFSPLSMGEKGLVQRQGTLKSQEEFNPFARAREDVLAGKQYIIKSTPIESTRTNIRKTQTPREPISQKRIIIEGKKGSQRLSPEIGFEESFNKLYGETKIGRAIDRATENTIKFGKKVTPKIRSDITPVFVDALKFEKVSSPKLELKTNQILIQKPKFYKDFTPTGDLKPKSKIDNIIDTDTGIDISQKNDIVTSFGGGLPPIIPSPIFRGIKPNIPSSDIIEEDKKSKPRFGAFGFRLFEGKNKRNFGTGFGFKSSRTASLEARYFNIKSPKSKLNLELEKTGLTIRPIVR